MIPCTGHVEALVKASYSVGPGDLGEAVGQPVELSRGAGLPHVRGQASPGEIEWVDEAQGGGPGGAAGRQVPGEVAPELRVLVHASQEHLLVLVLEGEVERLGGEVADDVGQVAAPVGGEALLLRDPHHAVDDALVLLVSADLLAGMLYLRDRCQMCSNPDPSLAKQKQSLPTAVSTCVGCIGMRLVNITFIRNISYTPVSYRALCYCLQVSRISSNLHNSANVSSLPGYRTSVAKFGNWKITYNTIR